MMRATALMLTGLMLTGLMLTGLMLTSLLLWGCGPVGGSTLDANSDGDQVRDQAMALFMERTLTDRIDGRGGDNTDWKYVDVVDKGRLSITIGIDTPQSLEGAELSLHDEFGGRLDRRLILPQQSSYVFAAEVEKVPNKYFIRVFATGGTSAYSVGPRIAYAVEAPPPRVVEPAPPPPVVVEPAPVPRRRAVRRRPRRQPKPQPAVKRPPPPAPVAALSGKVVRVTPSADNSFVTISIRVSGATPLRKGMRGQVMQNGKPMPGGRFTVSGVRGRRISARVSLPQGKFTGRLSARISP